MARKKKQLPFTDQIRQAVADSDWSQYKLAKAIGCTQSSLSRFMSGAGLLHPDYLNVLADLLGLYVAVDSSKAQPVTPDQRFKSGRKPSGLHKSKRRRG
ncbi:helix-turn-helix domain-containing protein [Planctomycetales bacterium ZRK34]|nr:helix-turn-helix domain-containing protein [Planctomycetales bacterium ZRK34]